MSHFEVTKRNGSINLSNSKIVAIEKEAADLMASRTQKRILKGIGPANSPLTAAVKGNRLTLRDTGGLMASIHSGVDTKGGWFGSNHVAAKVHQHGLRIVAKGKHLWIPAGAETRRLQRRYSYNIGEMLRRLKANQWGFYKSKSGKAFMAVPPGKSKKPFPLFILKKEVTIPKRKFLFVDETDKKIIKRRFHSFYEENNN